MASHNLPEAYFDRHDESDDALFYHTRPRETYLDENAVASLKSFLGTQMPKQGVYLDLLSGWRSYLPDRLQPDHVVGLGLSPEAMAENSQLDEFHAVDLNRRPILPFADERFDAVLCTASVQYLTKPVEVFQQVYRVLKPGGQFVIAFSSGCFPEKAIAIWLITTAEQRTALVKNYFRLSGNWVDIRTWSPPGNIPNEHKQNRLHYVWAYKPVSGGTDIPWLF